jgi:hypothetical protein
MSFEGNCSSACGTSRSTSCARAKTITNQIINLEIDNIIQDQMVRIGEAMVRRIRITRITNVVIIKIINSNKME